MSHKGLGFKSHRFVTFLIGHGTEQNDFWGLFLGRALSIKTTIYRCMANLDPEG